MIRLLSLIGRATIVIAAVVIVVGSAMAGYLTPDLHPYFAGYGYERQLGALLGFVAGIVTAGIIFGPLATLYDIRDNVRRLAKNGEGAPAPGGRRAGGSTGTPFVRREPKLPQ